MEFEIVDPAKRPRWNDMVQATTGYSFFHSVNWAQVLSTSYNYRPAYFTLSEEGKLLATIPLMEVKSALTGKRGVSLAFTDYCEPIAQNRDNFAFLLNQVIDYGRSRGWGHIEFRGGQRYLQDAPIFNSYLGHALTLSEDGLFAQFRDSTKRNIRKAALAGVVAKTFTTLQAVREYYRLHCMTRKRHGLPPQPFSFFKNIHKFIISRNLGFVVLASYDGTPIAGAVFFHFNTQGLYKFGASNEAYQHLRANNLAMWEAMQWLSRHGIQSLDFGRTDPENTGLLQFKRGWGAHEYSINYFKYDFRQGVFVADPLKRTRLQKRVFSMMPLPLLKMAGSMLYRHAG